MPYDSAGQDHPTYEGARPSARNISIRDRRCDIVAERDMAPFVQR